MLRRTANPYALSVLVALNALTFVACGSDIESKRAITQGETGGSTGTATGGSGGAGNAGKAGSSAGNPGSSGGSASASSSGALEPCTGPSIDRLKTWGPTEVEGMTADPPTTKPSVLVKDSDQYVAKLSFSGTGWGVAQILLANKSKTAVDLSKTSEMTVTYSATADFRLQMRALSSWSGGHHYAAVFPSTGGEKKSVTMTFEAKNWTQPSWAESLVFSDVLKEVQGFTISVDTPNSLVFYGLRVAGYVPECN